MKKGFKLFITFLAFAIFLSIPVKAKAYGGNSLRCLHEKETTLYVGFEKYDMMIGRYIGDILTYTSSNKKVATVSKKGVITPKKKGKAVITVKIKCIEGNTITLKFKVTVKDPYVSIKNKIREIEDSATYSFNGQTYGLKNKDIVWTVSNTNAEINYNTGFFKPLKPGTVKVTATNIRSKKSASITVKILDNTAPKIKTITNINKGVATVSVTASDATGISAIYYGKGTGMNAATNEITKSKTFTATQNGIYTIKAIDNSGLISISTCNIKVSELILDGYSATGSTGTVYKNASKLWTQIEKQISNAANIYRISGTIDIDGEYNDIVIRDSYYVKFYDENDNIIYQSPCITQYGDPFDFVFDLPDNCHFLYYTVESSENDDIDDCVLIANFIKYYRK